MSKWKSEIIESSNGVYRIIMTHEFGSIIDMTGTDIEVLKAQAAEEALNIEKKIGDKLNG
ncbi:MAG: hypothetical protein R8G66_13255 [Cytophagales bacterium]|nr:hypothetical protein [Cytophagales bacterium]